MAVLSTALWAPCLANAAPIVGYDAGVTDSFTSPSVVTAPEVTADLLTAGPGLTDATGLTFNFGGWNGATDFASAVSAGNVFTWGFDVTDNVLINLTTLDMLIDRSGSGPPNFSVQAAINGAPGVIVYSKSALSENGETLLGNDISALLPTLIQGDSIVFTLGAWGATSASGTLDFEPYSGSVGLAVNGDIAPGPAPVPEPAGVLLFALGIAAILAGRRSFAG